MCLLLSLLAGSRLGHVARPRARGKKVRDMYVSAESPSRAAVELFTAIAAIRCEPSDSAATRAAWRQVDRYVRRIAPRAADDDLRQDILVSIIHGVRSLRADDAVGAAAWVRSVFRSRRADEYRRHQALRPTWGEPGRQPEPAARASIPHGVAERVLAAFDERIERFLAESPRKASVRERRRVQAQAALRRVVLEQSLPEIRASLDRDISLQLLAKWIERGRAILVATVEHDRTTDPDLAEFFAPIAQLALERRADAGVPRPARRKNNA